MKLQLIYLINFNFKQSLDNNKRRSDKTIEKKVESLAENDDISPHFHELLQKIKYRNGEVENSKLFERFCSRIVDVLVLSLRIQRDFNRLK